MENKTQAREVQQMFTQIAPHYDFMNHLLTVNRDTSWRREVIDLIQLPPTGSLLDLGSGTGKLAKEALLQYPNAHIVAADFTFDMMKIGNQENQATTLSWCAADALHVPFPDNSFDAVVSGFLLRNVKGLDKCLKEQFRVLKFGGKLVALDTTQPTPHLFSTMVNFYLTRVIPRLGQVITGNYNAYHYLPTSTLNFLTAESLANCISSTGFHQVGFRRFMYGTVAIHWGAK
jgi:demethylmenaquinone methyltransferase/2-methoxy-6-polyprenyl-1,4-benzoquinol methylase